MTRAAEHAQLPSTFPTGGSTAAGVPVGARGGSPAEPSRSFFALAVVVGVLLASGVTSLWWFALSGDDAGHLEPHGHMRAVLAEEWIDAGKPTLPLEHFDELPDDVRVALTPRDASMLDGEVVPKDFAYSLALTALAALFGTSGPIVAAALCGVAAAVAVGLVVHCLTRSTPFSAMASLLAYGSLFWWAASWGGHTVTLAGVAFGLGAVYVLLGGGVGRLPGPALDRFVVAGVLAGLAVGFHYAMLVWWGALGAAFAIGHAPLPSIARRLLRFTVGMCLGMAPIAVFNEWIYGSPLTNGYVVFDVILDSIGWKAGSIAFSGDALWRNARTYVVRLEVAPVAVLSLVASLRFLRSSPLRHAVQAGVAIAGLLALTGLSGSSVLWGSQSFQTNASFLRYLAGPYALALAVGMAGARSLWQRGALHRAAAIAVVCCSFAFNGTTVLQGPNGFIATWDIARDAKAMRSSLLAAVPPRALVVTNKMDKLLFPARSVLIASYLQDSPPEAATGRHLYESVPGPVRLAQVLSMIDHAPLYIFNDGGWISASDRSLLQLLLEMQGRCVVPTPVAELWEVESCPSST